MFKRSGSVALGAARRLPVGSIARTMRSRVALSRSQSTAAGAPAGAGSAAAAASPASGTKPLPNSNSAAAKPAKKRFKFRYFLLAISPLVAYWWMQRSARKKVLEDSGTSVVSANEKEIKDLLQRCNLSATDIERLSEHLERSVVAGRTSVDAFAKCISDYVNAQKNLVKEEKERKKQAVDLNQMQASIDELMRVRGGGQSVEQYVDQQLAAEDRLRAELKMQGKELPADLERRQAAEDAKNETLDDKARIAKFGRERFDAWDLLCLLRATPVDRYGVGDVQEMIVALAQMSFDSKPEEELVADPDMHQRQVEQMNLNPFTKVEAAWRAVDRDRDGLLSHADFTRLMSHMLHTGHFAAETALHRTQAWPTPQFRMSTPQELADAFYAQLGLQPSAPIRLADFTAAAEALARSKQTRLTVWYLPQEHLGFFKSARLKWQEEVMRLYRTQQKGAPLAGIAQEREAARLERIAQLKVDRATIRDRIANKQREQRQKMADTIVNYGKQ